MSVTTITSQDQINKLSNGILVLNFWADWSKQCEQTNDVFQKLSQKYTSISFGQVEAEKVPDVTEKYTVLSVPFFVFIRGGVVVDQLEGVNIPALNEKIVKYNKEAPAATTPQAQTQAAPASATGNKAASLNGRLEKLINYAPVMLFMKGSPDQPQCGFSRKIVDLLNQEAIEFSSFNIFSDEEVRQGLKEYSNWPTYPQLYISGKLVGGLDIVKELAEAGELKEMVPATEKKVPLNERLTTLINSNPIMIFIKGAPGAPKCGFSGKLISLLEQEGVKFGSFDILSDEEVRQGLKTFSNWPTYPQVYANGKLVGGLDIIKELQEQGELKEALSV